MIDETRDEMVKSLEDIDSKFAEALVKGMMFNFDLIDAAKRQDDEDAINITFRILKSTCLIIYTEGIKHGLVWESLTRGE